VRASAIVLAHGPEPLLLECVRALAAQHPGEILVVDNEAAPGAVDSIRGEPGVRVLSPGTNLGFAGGCNLAAQEARGDVLVFVNSDAIVQEAAVAALVARAVEPDVGLVSGSIRLAESPGLLNSLGNPVHYLMFSWAGGLGEPAERHATPQEIGSISGAAFAVRRDVWDELGGFDPLYFAYCEDVYLSVRARQAGYRVVYEPSSVVLHHYEFGRNATKHYLLERNRLMNLLLLPERRTRWLVALPAVVVEVGVLGVAVRDGWASDKVAGWRWLLRHRRELALRRLRIESSRRVPDRDLASMFVARLDPPPGLGPAVPSAVSTMLDAYWTRVVRWL
jgi:GT2 family glycosyltransferase